MMELQVNRFSREGDKEKGMQILQTPGGDIPLPENKPYRRRREACGTGVKTLIQSLSAGWTRCNGSQARRSSRSCAWTGTNFISRWYRIRFMRDTSRRRNRNSLNANRSNKTRSRQNKLLSKSAGSRGEVHAPAGFGNWPVKQHRFSRTLSN